MANLDFSLHGTQPKVVGSFGSLHELQAANLSDVREACDIAEIRLDLLHDVSDLADLILWRHLTGFPLLFTARRGDEGGAGNLNAGKRMSMLEIALHDATCVDIEVASIAEMSPLVQTLNARKIPWIASFHDFEKLPKITTLEKAAREARDAGAAIFKVAAKLDQPADIARLAEFQLSDQGILLATMGMGPLATVSRLLCAQCGSRLNYGYLGKTATAPGQWHAAQLSQVMRQLVPFPQL